MMAHDEFIKWIRTIGFIKNTINSAHESSNSALVGHTDGFCLACAEMYLALNVALEIGRNK